MAFQRLILKKALQQANSKALNGRCRSFSSIPSASSCAAASSAADLKFVLPPFDYEPRPYNGPLADEVFQKRKQFLGPSLFHYYQKPLNIVEGKMHYLFDESGRHYLDAFAGIVTVSCGHCHPNILAAVNAQNKLLQHATTIYLHYAIEDFAEALATKMPGNLKVVYFVNSGTEANELEMLMARIYSGNLCMIAVRNAYHGGSPNTIGLKALNTWKYPIPQGEIHHVVNPNPYHGIFVAEAAMYAKDLQDQIDFGTSRRVAGFIAETIQGVGGAVELAPGYLKLAYDIVHKAVGVCIMDEVQTGFGRTRSHYWGFQTQGIGNGLPLGAVVTMPEIASTMSQKIQSNAYGGNPVCFAGGLAVLSVINNERRHAHCANVGSHLLERLRSSISLSFRHINPRLNRFFSSSARTQFFASNGTVAQYLIDTFNLSPARAAAIMTSRKGIESTQKPQSVHKYLSDLGLTDAQIQSTIRNSPQIAFSSIERTLKPKIEFFQNLGLIGSDLCEFISKKSMLLSLSLEKKLIPNVEILKGIFPKDECSSDLLRVMRRRCDMLLTSPSKRLLVNISYLQSCGIVESQLSMLMKRQPEIFGMCESQVRDIVARVVEIGFTTNTRMFVHGIHVISSVSSVTFKRKMELICSFGITEEECMRMFTSAPVLLRTSIGKLKLGLEFFLNEAKVSKLELLSRPTCLMHSLQGRVLPWYRVLQVLKLRRLLKKNLTLIGTLAMSEEEFMHKYVFSFPDDVVYLLVALRG